MFFVLSGFATEIGRIFRKFLRPMFLDKAGQPKPTKIVYDVIGTLITAYMLAYLGVSFLLLVPTPALHVWSYDYGLSIFIPILFYFATPFILPKPPRRGTTPPKASASTKAQ
eukprot:TRINITY_DN17713_c0_g1_i1.p2 TRINITY_DN17713_c0_g1~~TRINITY_DN17713_c0_g1_i1.p2  ORF type:complete len:112 (+),score=6.71 TRINITY_DN17713_c0_g1_i1:160-495(+)